MLTMLMPPAVLQPAAPAGMCFALMASAAVMCLDLLVSSMKYPAVEAVLSADPHMPRVLARACDTILQVSSMTAQGVLTGAISSLLSLLRLNAEGIWVGSHHLVAKVLLHAVTTLRWDGSGRAISISAACAFAKYCANDSDGWLTCPLPSLSSKDCLDVVPSAGTTDFGPPVADAGLSVSVAHMAACNLLRVIFSHITQATEQQQLQTTLPQSSFSPVLLLCNFWLSAPDALSTPAQVLVSGHERSMDLLMVQKMLS